MSWEAIGAGILAFIGLLTGFAIYLIWQLYCEVRDAKEERVEKKGYEERINTPLGSADVRASGSLEDGLSVGGSASLTPDGRAAASGVGAAIAYEALLGVAGIWTVPFIAGGALAFWLYKKQKDAKKAANPPGPGTL